MILMRSMFWNGVWRKGDCSEVTGPWWENDLWPINLHASAADLSVGLEKSSKILYGGCNTCKTVCILCGQKLATNVELSETVWRILFRRTLRSSGQKHFGFSEASVRASRGLALVSRRGCRCLNETGQAVRPEFGLLHLSCTV